MTLFILFSLAIALATFILIGAPLLRRGEKNEDGGTAAKRVRLAGLGALAIAPLAAAYIYSAIGTPSALNPSVAQAPTPSDPAAQIAAMEPDQRAVMIEGMVSGLAARLAADPQDLEGWRMLARSYGVLERHDESANAWREALALSKGAVDDWRGLAIALVESSDANAAPAVKEAFEEVLLQEPEDPLALYFLGHAALRDGDSDWGKELLTRLRAQTPDGTQIAVELDGILAQLEAPAPTQAE